nr:hypothetical protein CFP56_62434 [Quercus suber]
MQSMWKSARGFCTRQQLRPHRDCSCTSRSIRHHGFGGVMAVNLHPLLPHAVCIVDEVVHCASGGTVRRTGRSSSAGYGLMLLSPLGPQRNVTAASIDGRSEYSITTAANWFSSSVSGSSNGVKQGFVALVGAVQSAKHQEAWTGLHDSRVSSAKNALDCTQYNTQTSGLSTAFRYWVHVREGSLFCHQNRGSSQRIHYIPRCLLALRLFSPLRSTTCRPSPQPSRGCIVEAFHLRHTTQNLIALDRRPQDLPLEKRPLYCTGPGLPN